MKRNLEAAIFALSIGVILWLLVGQVRADDGVICGDEWVAFQGVIYHPDIDNPPSQYKMVRKTDVVSIALFVDEKGMAANSGLIHIVDGDNNSTYLFRRELFALFISCLD